MAADTSAAIRAFNITGGSVSRRVCTIQLRRLLLLLAVDMRWCRPSLTPYFRSWLAILCIATLGLSDACHASTHVQVLHAGCMSMDHDVGDFDGNAVEAGHLPRLHRHIVAELD